MLICFINFRPKSALDSYIHDDKTLLIKSNATSQETYPYPDNPISRALDESFIKITTEDLSVRTEDGTAADSKHDDATETTDIISSHTSNLKKDDFSSESGDASVSGAGALTCITDINFHNSQPPVDPGKIVKNGEVYFS